MHMLVEMKTYRSYTKMHVTKGLHFIVMFHHTTRIEIPDKKSIVKIRKYYYNIE